MPPARRFHSPNRPSPTAPFALRSRAPSARGSEAQLGRFLAGDTRILNRREQLEQAIEAEVRNTLQAVRSAEARLAAASARSSAEQQYESEQRRFQASLSTVFLILQCQTALFSARGRELQAQTDLNTAIAEFRRVTGSTLERYHVTLKTDGPSHKLEQRTVSADGNAVAAGESKP